MMDARNKPNNPSPYMTTIFFTLYRTGVLLNHPGCPGSADSTAASSHHFCIWYFFFAYYQETHGEAALTFAWWRLGLMDTPQAGLSLSIARGAALIIYLYSPLHFPFICQHLFVFFSCYIFVDNKMELDGISKQREEPLD